MVRVGLIAAALLALAACSSKGDSAKPAELVDFKPSLALKSAWRVNVGAGRGAPLQPALLENAIYAAAAEGTLMRVAPATGEIVWRVDTGAALSAGVGSDGFVVAVADDRDLFGVGHVQARVPTHELVEVVSAAHLGPQCVLRLPAVPLAFHRAKRVPKLQYRRVQFPRLVVMLSQQGEVGMCVVGVFVGHKQDRYFLRGRHLEKYLGGL